MQFVTSKEASKRLGVHPNTLRRWANKGQIKVVKTKAGQRLYDVESFVKENQGKENERDS